MFLDKSDDDIPFTPPYDCQFITVSQINQSSYVLSEIYTLKTKRVIADYGTWDLNKGLNVSATLMYLRRTNMNQTLFVALKFHNKCEVRCVEGGNNPKKFKQIKRLSLIFVFLLILMLQEIEHRQYTFCWYTDSLKDIVKHLNFRYANMVFLFYLCKLILFYS